jgi:YHS domain-containing protein
MVSMIGLMLLSIFMSRNLGAAVAPARTALKGLDPVEFVAGKAVQGKPSLSADHGKFRYIFANEKNRATFSKNPDRYSIQGDGTCPVAPTEQVDPGLVTVYKEKIYAFATLPCIGRFMKDPEKYLAKWQGNPDKKK